MSKMGDYIIQGEEEGWLENMEHSGEPSVYELKKKPLPNPRRNLGKLPFDEMEVGDVFVVPQDPELQKTMTDKDARGWESALRNRMRTFCQKNPGYRFTARLIPEGVECQRTA